MIRKIPLKCGQHSKGIGRRMVDMVSTIIHLPTLNCQGGTEDGSDIS